MSSVQARKDEILAKKARLAELKKQREIRQKEFTSNRQSLSSDPTELAQSSPLRNKSTRLGDNEDLDSLVSSLLPATPGTPRRKRGSGTDQAQAAGGAEAGEATPQGQRSYANAGTDTQTLGFTGLTTVYEIPVETKPEYISYSKGVQTSRSPSPGERNNDEEEADDGAGVGRRRRKLSQRERELDEEQVRQKLRVEIEEELKALQLHDQVSLGGEKERFPTRPLQPQELKAVTSSNDFLDFVERSSKVIERALDEEYDVLADYSLQTRGLDQEAEEDDYAGHRRGRRVKEVASFDLQDAMGRKRMVSSIDFSPKFSELVATNYTKSQQSPHTPPGLLNVWNTHLKGRPEYSLNATSDLLSCLWHPFHPNLISALTLIS